MAVVYDRESLSPSDVSFIAKELTLLPTKVFGGPDDEGDVKPIRFFLLKDGYLRVPAQFGRKHGSDELPNSHKNYNQLDFRFTGTLNEEKDQINIHQEAMDQLYLTGGTTLVLPCGTGKTILSAKLAADIGGTTLVIFTITPLIKSWYKTFTEQTTAKVWVVNEPGYEVPAYVDVILCMKDRVKHIPAEILEDVQTLIIDEAHLLCIPSAVEPLLMIEPQFVIACTATPKRPDGMESMLHLLAGDHEVYRPFNKKMTVYKVNTWMNHPTVDSITGRGIDWNKLLDEITYNDDRNMMIARLCIVNPERKIMILTSRVNHAKMLTEILTELGEDVQLLTGKKKRCDDSRILVAGYKKAGTGFDLANYVDNYDDVPTNMIIMATPFKDKTQNEQASGRARGELPIIYDLVDDNKTTQNQWKLRRAWYNKVDAKIIEVNDVLSL